MPGHRQRSSSVIGVVGADHQLTAWIEFTCGSECDGERQRRTGAQRRRERTVNEPELAAALTGAASFVVVVAENMPVWCGMFAQARFRVFRRVRPALVVPMMMLAMMLAALLAAARRGTASAAWPAAIAG